MSTTQKRKEITTNHQRTSCQALKSSKKVALQQLLRHQSSYLLRKMSRQNHQQTRNSLQMLNSLNQTQYLYQPQRHSQLRLSPMVRRCQILNNQFRKPMLHLPIKISHLKRKSMQQSCRLPCKLSHSSYNHRQLQSLALWKSLQSSLQPTMVQLARQHNCNNQKHPLKPSSSLNHHLKCKRAKSLRLSQMQRQSQHL